MDESEENMSAEDTQNLDSPGPVKIKPKKRSLVERELETNLTARVTSPVTLEGSSTSRYGRSRKLKIFADIDTVKIMKPLKIDVSKQPQAYKMHASNSPISKESPKRTISVGSSIEDQIENIYNENMALSRFGSEEKAKFQSPAKKFSKIYIRKDMIQKPDNDTVALIKNMFSPTKSSSHLNNILERSSEKYALNGHGKSWNGIPDTSSVVKTLDFDSTKKKENIILKNDDKKKEKVISKNELFNIEATCEYQVGDLAWARVGTYPFWPCIVTREPFSDMFVKKKLFGRVEHSVIHVTFFGDNGRRGWIVDNMLRKYHGRAEFESSRNKFTPEAKKKDPRLYAAHFVSEKKLPLWNISVDEAETLMKEPKRLRIDILYDMLEKVRASKTTPKREKGGKLSRTDSDVSLSESLYDTLFSEEDFKTDDNSRSKRARNKSLDVSEVVTACLDNMAAKSGIIQIQRQSHMDRWLQKAKSKTPEKMQPKLHLKIKKEKRNDRVKKKSKEEKKARKVRKNESLGSNANLLPYQNEHDYSSVNYENQYNSSNKNTDSASGLDSTLDNSNIGVMVKIESLSSSMEDLSQDDIITTVVNDDIFMTDPENISNGDGHIDINNEDVINDIVENNNDPSRVNNKSIENEIIKAEIPVNNSAISNTIQPRRSKRKRHTFEGLNNSIIENNAKEPKLDLTEPDAIINITTTSDKPESKAFQENTIQGNNDCDSTGKSEPTNKPTISKLLLETNELSKPKSIEITFNTNSKPVVIVERCRDSTKKPDQESNESTISKLSIEKAPCSNLKSIEFTSRSRRSKDKLDSSRKGSNNPEFMKYLEIRQDALLDEQPDLTQDEIVTYMYQNWLYEEDNKSEIKKIDDNVQSNVVNGSNQEPMPRSKKNKKKSKAENAPQLNNVDITDMMDSKNKATELKLDSMEPEAIINITTPSDKPENKPIQENTIQGNNDCDSTGKSEPTNEPTISKVLLETNELSKPKSIEIKFNTNSKPVVIVERCRDSTKKPDLECNESTISKLTIEEVPCSNLKSIEFTSRPRRSKDKLDSGRKGSNNPEFMKYLEIRQDALLDEQPDLTQDEIVTYLYQNWLHEEDNKSEIKKIDDIVQSNVVKGSNQEPMPRPKKNKKKRKAENAPQLNNVDITDMMDSKNKATELKLDSMEPEAIINITTPSDKPENKAIQENTIQGNNDCDNTGKSEPTNEPTISKVLLETNELSKPKSIEIKFNTNSKPVVIVERCRDSTKKPDLECNKSTISKLTIEEVPCSNLKSIEFTRRSRRSKDKLDSSRKGSNNPEFIRDMMDKEKLKPVSDLSKKDVNEEMPPEEDKTSCEGIKNTIQGSKDTQSITVHKVNNVIDIKSNEFSMFNTSSKPIVVIEQLNLVGLDAQLIIKGSEQLIQNKPLKSVNKNDKYTDDKLGTPDLVQSKAVNDSFKDPVNTTEESAGDKCSEKVYNKPHFDLDTPTSQFTNQAQDDVSTVNHQEAEEKNYSGKIAVYDCAAPVVVEENKNYTMNPETDPYPAIPLETEAVEVSIEPLVQKNCEIIPLKNTTSVVIGEETYIFDRTLSQDYDEIDASEYDEVSVLPAGSNNVEAEDACAIESALDAHEEKSSPDSMYVSKTSGLKSTEGITRSKVSDLTTYDDCRSVNESTKDVNIPDVPEATSDLLCNTVFLDKRSKQNESKTVPIDDNKLQTVASEVSNVINDEQNKSNRVNEENNAKCVFLDRSLETTNAQSADSIEKKIKPPRLRLNRSRKPSLQLNKVVNDLQTLDNSCNKLNTDTEKCVSEPASTDSNASETTVTNRIRHTKDKLDDKMRMNNPEFIKYLEIRQDALLDEQPDLTQDEIVSYLYQNWLYEESNKSEMKKIDDNEQSNLVKGSNQEPLSQPMKNKKKPKVGSALESKKVNIRDIMNIKKNKPVPDELESQCKPLTNGITESNKHPEQHNTCEVVNNTPESKDTQNIPVNIVNDVEHTKSHDTSLEDSNSKKEINVALQLTACSDNIAIKTEPKSNADCKDAKISGILKPAQSVIAIISAEVTNRLNENSSYTQDNLDVDSDEYTTNTESVHLDERTVIETNETYIGNVVKNKKDNNKDAKEHALYKRNGFIENEEVTKTSEVFDPKIVSIKSEDSELSVTTRKSRKEKQDNKNYMDDPEFLKYLEARQDALIDEQPNLTQEEIVTYLYQTWFYEENQKSDVKKIDDTEQSNLVKGLNQEPAPQPRKYKKKLKVEKEIKIENEPVEKVLKNADIRDMVQKEKPKRKATQSKPYYNEDDSDLEEEDLETFKIFDSDEQNENGEEIDEVELYFEQLTKPKPNVFKGYVRERVCEICDQAGNLVKCKSCHGTFHVECVKKGAEVIEVAAPTRGRKKKRGRKPKNYDPLLDCESQSDERSQDANNSGEMNISVEDDNESHIVIDADNFETQWENKLKDLKTEILDEYASDQEINWEVEPGHCEIVDLKHKEKPIDYSDYKCNNCLKYDTPVCFVCKSDKSPKSQTEVRQKCQVAHCHRYYHLECLDHWPQTQFNSWEPSKTNKKVIEYIEALSCPRHVCHTCVSDDPRGCKTRFCGDKLARCVKCPATYHSYTKCLPAGTQILTGSQIICPRHYDHRPGKVPCHVNTGWCFICALGGTLICCEYCPTSFHAECLNIKPPEGSYMCEDCETGRLPLYGEMVWVKLGHYRWWPGIVLHPTEIPDNILAVKHSPGEFVVRFFGQYDHYWVNRGRVFPFQEGDSGRISSQKSKIDAAFTTAMEHAQRACKILKNMVPNEEEDLDIASSLLPPHYVKLKVNKPVGSVARKDMDANSLTQCDCDPTQPDPCGPYSHCLNRMLLTECGPQCRAGERCNNRAFERRLYPRLQAYRTPHRGWGLRTLEDIKQGQFVIEYVGELIDMEEFRRRMCRKHEIRDENFYFLTLDKERMIDAGPKGNLARFMNHCCEPNCETQKWTVLGDVRVGLFALRDIPANSEVTFNYNLECAGIEKKRCLCGAKRCSGYIGAKPKQLQDDLPKKPKRTYKKRKPVEDTSKPKLPKIKIKPLKPRELTEIEKDLLIINSATNGMSSDSEGSRVSVDDKNPKALKRKRVSFSTDEGVAKKAKLAESEEAH